VEHTHAHTQDILKNITNVFVKSMGLIFQTPSQTKLLHRNKL